MTAPASALASRPAPTRRQLAASSTGRWLALATAFALLAVMVLASLALGARPVAPEAVVQALVSPAGGMDDVVVRMFRIPRTLMGLLVGAALGGAGALMQALTRNPLADPGLLGVNAGAAFAIAVGISLFGVGQGGFIWLALLGALAGALAVYALGASGAGGATPVKLALAGVALGAVLGGMTTLLALNDPAAFGHFRYWNVGALGASQMAGVAHIAPFIATGGVLALALAHTLNALALGDDGARALGANVARTRLLGVAAIALLCGAATAAVGPIAFLGLVMPHFARRIGGPDERWVMAYSMVLAPALLLAADIIGRLILPHGEMQAGIVTAVIGAPVLIVLVRRARWLQ